MAVSIRLALVSCFAWAAMASDVKVVELIVAKVNGDIVTTGELARSRRDLEENLKQQGLSGPKLEAELQAREPNLLRDRMDSLLLVQKAKELGLSVDSEVTKRLADMQRQAKLTDRDKFQELVSRETGMPFEDFRQQLRDQAMTQRLIQQEVGSKITIPRAEQQQYYDAHKDEFIRKDRVFLSQIAVSTEGKDPKEIPALEKKAKSLVERARQGEKFAELARDNSDDQDAAQTGGALPALDTADLNAQLKEIVTKQEKGYVTDPLPVTGGFLIFKIEEKHTAGLASFEEVENEIQGKLWEPRYEAASRPYLTELRMQAFLEIREGYIDTSAAPGKSTKWLDPAQLKPETVTKEEVALKVRRKRLLWLAPMPGTKTNDTSTSASN
jgi:peptidyl-prolyl cis-trans isomerase SurA